MVVLLQLVHHDHVVCGDGQAGAGDQHDAVARVEQSSTAPPIGDVVQEGLALGPDAVLRLGAEGARGLGFWLSRVIKPASRSTCFRWHLAAPARQFFGAARWVANRSS